MVAVGGLKLLASYALDRRSSLVTACALGMAIGVMMVPEALAELPNWLENILLSPVTSAGLTAVILDLTLPGKKTANDNSEVSAATGNQLTENTTSEALDDSVKTASPEIKKRAKENRRDSAISTQKSILAIKQRKVLRPALYSAKPR
jgi:xanthine permease XanP